MKTIEAVMSNGLNLNVNKQDLPQKVCSTTASENKKESFRLSLSAPAKECSEVWKLGSAKVDKLLCLSSLKGHCISEHLWAFNAPEEGQTKTKVEDKFLEGKFQIVSNGYFEILAL